MPLLAVYDAIRILKTDFDAVLAQKEKAYEIVEANERDLREKTKELEEANIALKVLLKNQEADRLKVEDRIMSNMEELIFPYLEKLLKSRLGQRHKALIEHFDSPAAGPPSGSRHTSRTSEPPGSGIPKADPGRAFQPMT